MDIIMIEYIIKRLDGNSVYALVWKWSVTTEAQFMLRTNQQAIGGLITNVTSPHARPNLGSGTAFWYNYSISSLLLIFMVV
jgi:hypothetical protein